MKLMNTLAAAVAVAGYAIGAVQAAPPVINDKKIMAAIGDKIGKLVEAKQTTGAKELQKQLARKKVAVKMPAVQTEVKEDLYKDCVNSVGIIASVYKCTKCPLWHNSGLATAWVLTADGIMVSNYHVFDGKDHPGFGVVMRDGTTYAVTEILAASKVDDIAIFRVKANGLKPLPLLPEGKDISVGKNVNIIAHPDSRFFTYTSGRVSRYYTGRGSRPATWMAVTAEYARGSSGGPVFDDKGNVCGMVANTQSIYYPSKKKGEKGPFQMVIRNCVPAHSLRKLIDAK